MSNKLYVSMYHYTRNIAKSRYPGIKGMSDVQFRAQIEYINEKFNVVCMEQVLDALNKKKSLPENALLLTFDDGYIDNYTCVFPILNEFKISGCFFIPAKTFSTHELLDVNKIHYILACAEESKLVQDIKAQMDFYRGQEFDYASTDELYFKYAVANRFDTKDTIFIKRMLQTVLPERLRNIVSSNLFEKYVGVTEEQLAYELYMSENQISMMKRNGMHIGVHGYDHYWLGNLPVEQMKKDIDKAIDTMDGLIDIKQWSMNYPYGNYNQEVINYIKAKGAKIGFTTEVRVADIELDSPFEIPRLDCNDFPPISKRYMSI